MAGNSKNFTAMLINICKINRKIIKKKQKLNTFLN